MRGVTPFESRLRSRTNLVAGRHPVPGSFPSGYSATFGTHRVTDCGASFARKRLQKGNNNKNSGTKWETASGIIVLGKKLVNVYIRGGFSDFNDLDICCQGPHSEQHFLLNFLVLGFGSRDICKKLNLIIQIVWINFSTLWPISIHWMKIIANKLMSLIVDYMLNICKIRE